MYKTTAEATTPRPNVFARAEQANFAAAKALHQERMKESEFLGILCAVLSFLVFTILLGLWGNHFLRV